MNLIAMNVEITTRMVHNVLLGMLKKKKGSIINIGVGIATVIPFDPLDNVYVATKVQGSLILFPHGLCVFYVESLLGVHLVWNSIG